MSEDTSTDFPAESYDGEAGEEVTFEQEVNAATAAMKQDDKGLWIVPKGLNEQVAFAAGLEKRRRDAQSALGKSDAKNAHLQTSVDTLKQRAMDNAQLSLTVAQKEELQDLKVSDPDAWKTKLEEYQQASIAAVEEELSELGHTGEAAEEEANRVQLLQKCLDDNPGLVLDDAVFENDLPPRITSKLQKGESTFEEFLTEAVSFLKPGTVVLGADDAEKDEPNLGKTGGSSEVSETSIGQDNLASYKTEVY